MSEPELRVVVELFSGENGAADALKRLQQADKAKMVDIENGVVLRRDLKGDLHLSETAERSAGRGAVIGGVTGAVAGLIVGPVGWVALGGAAIGALATKMHDGGFPDQRLRELGERLTPGSSALIAVVRSELVDDVEQQLAVLGADLLTEELSVELAEEIEATFQDIQQRRRAG